MAIGAIVGVIGLKFLTWVLNNHEPAVNPNPNAPGPPNPELSDWVLTRI